MAIHSDILFRYDAIIASQGIKWAECDPDPGTSLAHLKWMLNELFQADMPADKENRWLGFIQGVLVMKGLISVSEEREFTRPYFIAAKAAA